jgi:hypothetical protein
MECHLEDISLSAGVGTLADAGIKASLAQEVVDFLQCQQDHQLEVLLVEILLLLHFLEELRQDLPHLVDPLLEDLIN